MKFWQEMRRRRVFRLAGLYIVGAWVVIEVASVFFPAWGIPDAALRFLFIAAAAGFPVALIFSWYYDITARGIVRTHPAGSEDSIDLKLRRTDYIVLTALLFVGVAVLVGSADKIQEEIESGHAQAMAEERRPNSIAVLPFKNLDINKQTGYFSEGITEEILHRLSTLGTLHVLASSSSILVDAELGPAEISQTLGVSYLLEGSIRRADDYVRVTARLLDDSGFQVWSETFDRELTEIFAVQSEIAGAVSRQIVSEIVPLESLPAGRTTDNMEAYNEYLLGRYAAKGREAGWKERADEAYRRAIELDPGFAPPYAGLAELVVNTDVGSHWSEALKLAERGLELDPNLAEAHAVHGIITVALGDPAAGEVSLERSIDLDPSLSHAYNWLSLAMMRQGRFDDAFQVQNRGLEIDPLNPPLVANVAGRESESGNFARAEQLLLRIARLPEPPNPAGDLLNLYSDWGRYADELAARKVLTLKWVSSDEPWLLQNLAINYARLGMTDEADYWIARLTALLPEDEDLRHYFYFLYKLYDDQSRLEMALVDPKELDDMHDVEYRAATLGYGGLAQIQAGILEQGIEQIETSLDLYQRMYRPDDPPDKLDVMLVRDHWWDTVLIPLAHRLAFAYQQVGRHDDADDILQQLEQVLGESTPKDPLSLEWHALQAALEGDVDGAHEFLSAAVELGWANYYEVDNDPAWAEIAKLPEFRTLLDSAKANVDIQRVIAEKADAAHVFRAEIDALLAD